MLEKKDLKAIKEIVDESVNDLAVIAKKEFEKASVERKEMKRSIEEIKMKFAYTAKQIDVKELQERVAFLEKKIGARKK